MVATKQGRLWEPGPGFQGYLEMLGVVRPSCRLDRGGCLWLHVDADGVFGARQYGVRIISTGRSFGRGPGNEYVRGDSGMGQQPGAMMMAANVCG